VAAADDDLLGNVLVEPLPAAAPASSGGARVAAARGGAQAASPAAPAPAAAARWSARAAPPPAAAASLARAPAAAQAAAVWHAVVTAGGGGLSEADVALPLTAAHMAVAAAPPAAAHASAARDADGGDVSDLADHVRALLPSWRSCLVWGGPRAAPVPAGSPAVLIVTGSASRAAHMLRPLASFHARVGKCFGKHLSLAEAEAALRPPAPPVALCVGTPRRLAALLASGALTLTRARLVVLDVHPDAKRFSLLDHPNLRGDTAALLREHLHGALTAPGSELRLALY